MIVSTNTEDGIRKVYIMAETSEALRTKKERQADAELLTSVNYGLEEAITHSGGIVSGISIKFGEQDYLMTLRATIGSNKMVSFVGAPTLRDCFRKASHLAWCDELRWRADKFGNGSN